MVTDPAVSQGSTSQRLPGLEVLRCVAAICVLLLHTRAVYGGRFIFGRGYLGVDFFLMLSGYLMARTQETRLVEGLNPWRFMAKRYRRLWPMMAAGGLIGMPMQYLRSAGVGRFVWVTLANLALVPVPFQPFVFPLNIPAWTIFYEMVANFLHVTLFWRLRGGWLMLALALLMPAMAAIGAWHGSFDVGARPGTFLAALPRVTLAYLLGVGLYRWWRDQPPLPVPPLLALVLMPVVIAASWWLGITGWAFDLAFVLLACPVMIAGALRLQRFGRQAALIGQLSFPLFALQMPILEGLRPWQVGAWVGGGCALAAGIAAALVSAWLRNRKQSPQPSA